VAARGVWGDTEDGGDAVDLGVLFLIRTGGVVAEVGVHRDRQFGLGIEEIGEIPECGGELRSRHRAVHDVAVSS
jgi:hypothetical protein